MVHTDAWARRTKKRPAVWRGAFLENVRSLAQAGIDRAEDLADLATQDGQNTNHNNGDQHQDQRVLDQALTILFSEETAKHCWGSPFVVKCSNVM